MKAIKMNIKTIIIVILILVLCASGFYGGACIGKTLWEKEEPDVEPLPLNGEQFKYIAELATVESYYHNVTKVYKEDYEKEWLLIKKDLNFWMDSEYDVTYGLNAELITFEVKENVVTVTIPKAKVLKLKNNSSGNNVYSAKNSAEVGNQEQLLASKEAQQEIYKEASNNNALLDKAQQQAKQLITNYINKIGAVNNVEYEIKWVDVDENGDPIKS